MTNYSSVVGKVFVKDGYSYFVESTFPFEGTIFAGLKQLGNWNTYRVPVQYLSNGYLGWSEINYD